jgi:adenylate cyclase
LSVALSIAVLPFKNMSSEVENDYFCDGITEEIINALAKIKPLKVTSRTSSFYYKNKNVPISEIAKTLHVSSILEGSVRLSGTTIRITAQLIHAEEDYHFWSETWDRELENIFEIQDEISLLIADKIRENFGHFELQDHLVTKQTEYINAYEYCLMAKFHKNKWNSDDIRIAENYYKLALELDPEYVQSMVGLSDVYSFMAMIGVMSFGEAWAKSTELVNKALELDPVHPEAFYQKANSSFFTECNYGDSLAHATKAIQLKPNYVEAQQFMSFLHVLAGNPEKAKKHLAIALGIDPLSPETLFFSAYLDYMMEDFTSSLSKLNDCLAVNPKNLPAHAVKPLCLLMLGRYDEVIHYFDDLQAEVVAGERNGALGLAYALKKDRENTAKYMDILQTQSTTLDGFTSDSYLFMIYAVLGEHDKAFDWIRTRFESKSTLLLLRFADPIVQSLKSDERYNAFHDLIFPSALPLASVTKKKKALLDQKTASECKTKLVRHLEELEPFLDPGLTLRSLADQIQIHPNQLSWLLNENIGKSFNEFINSYRLETFKRIALDPKNANLTLIGLAYDAGFNSKTVFNTYFKKEMGQTPKEYLTAR